MSATDGARPRQLRHGDLWALGILFFLSRVPWLINLSYHGDGRVGAFILISIAVSLSLVFFGHALARFMNSRVFDYFARAAVLAMFMFLVSVPLRQFLMPAVRLTNMAQAAIAVVGVLFAAVGARYFASVWPRLRTALLVATLIATTSPFALAAVLAPRSTLFADSKGPHRNVVVLLLDEFSAGSARDLAATLSGRGLQVQSWAFASIGRNTIDAIPAIFTGRSLPDARPCTPSAVCGRSRVVDFGRLSVARNDVDIVGIYHPYCAMSGLRYCVNQERSLDEPMAAAFLCALPSRFVLGSQLGCDRTGSARPRSHQLEQMERDLFGAPFWSKGGLLYVHLLLPHPPSVSGETQLADTYAANVARAKELVFDVLGRLGQGPSRDDFALVITSDHHLRSEVWCKVEPYVRHDCQLPAEMLTAEIPFIVANRGAGPLEQVPHSNADLLAVVAELSRPR